LTRVIIITVTKPLSYTVCGRHGSVPRVKGGFR
jgi:hypothetical protein